ncbi:hypothetical protein [Enterobacter asburiae]|uniref:hypothetical protein n=1 Tax=Enterobacter asburiae TaxID=61645 RepID=UPI0011D21218|nr:hypothetical protein [Enterobacter asburiae]
MNLNIDKFTAIALNVANKVPFIFPKVFSINAKDYHSESDYIREKKNEKPNIYYVSLFETPFKWNAISFSMLMDSDELTKLKKWQEKRSRFNSTKTNVNIQPKSFDQENGWINIGLVQINKRGMLDDLHPIFLENDCFDGVYITLTKYSAGLSFVTFYIALKESLTQSISNVPVSKLEYYVKLTHLNVYSRKCSSVIMKDYFHHSEDILFGNINNIQKDALNLLKKLMKEIKIKKSSHELCCFYDMVIEQNTPYFDGCARNLRKHNVILSRRRKFVNAELSKDKFKSFIGKSAHKIKDVDWIYLRVKPREIRPANRKREQRYISNSGTHLSLAPFLLMNEKVNKISGYLNNLKLHNKNQSLEVMHKHLYTISYELKLISAWLLSARKNMSSHVPKEYSETVDRIIKININRVGELNGIVNGVYSLSENRIQIKNIMYNKRYSSLVFLLVIVQIILAAMTIDLNKKDAWYYPVVNILKEYVK